MFLRTDNKMAKFYYMIFISIMFASDFIPESGQVINYTQVFFRWPQISNHGSYQLILADNLLFTDSDTITVTSNSILYNDFLDWESEYYWKVCGTVDNTDTCLPTKYFSTSSLPDYHTNQIYINYINEDQYTEGVNVLDFESLNYSLAIDKYGSIIWFSDKDNFNSSKITVTQFLDNGNMMGFSNGKGYEFNLDSEIIFETPSVYSIHHYISKSDEGTYFFIDADIEYHDCPVECSDEFSIFPIPWQGDRFIEIDSNGEIIWEWNTFENISLSEYNPYYAEIYNGTNDFDWTHSNSVLYDPLSQSVYVSLRNLSRITSIDYPTGEVNWNLGESDFMENPSFQNELDFSQQHSAQLTPSGNLIFFDNARYQDPELSRCIEVEFDDNNEPFIAWQHVLPDSMFTGSRGECDRLSSGNSLISAGRTGNVIEVDSNNQLIWHLNVDDNNGNDVTIYRTERILNMFPSIFSFEIEQISGDSSNYTIIDNGSLDITIYNHGWGIDGFEYFLYNETDQLILSGEVDQSTSVIELSVDISDYIFDGDSYYSLTVNPINNSENIQETTFHFLDALLGDINGDNELDILDITGIVYLIIDNSEFLENADINEDGNIDIFDVILLLNIIIDNNN